MREMLDGQAKVARRPSPLRYLPAALAAGACLALLLLFPGATRWADALSFGLWLDGKGDPPPSRSTLIVTPDRDERGALGTLDGDALARLASALLEMRPAVLALDLPDAGAAWVWSAEGSLPQGPVVFGIPFKSFGPWSRSEKAKEPYPPILARSLYPFLDGPATAGLALPLGEGLDWPDSLRWPNASLGFTGPLPEGTVASVPAFARLGRGVAGSLAVEAARRALGQPAEKVGYVEGLGALFDPTHMLPLNEHGETLVRHHPQGGIPEAAASQVLAGSLDRAAVEGKVVFVDAAGGTRPYVSTPQGPRTVTEMWAASADNLLEGATISSPAWGRVLSTAMGLAFAALLAIAIATELGGAATFGLSLLLAALYPMLSFWFFLRSSWWLPPQLPPLMVLATWLPFALTRMLAPRRMPVPFAPATPTPMANMFPPLPQHHPATPMRGTPVALAPAPPHGAAPRNPEAGFAAGPAVASAPGMPPTPARGTPFPAGLTARPAPRPEEARPRAPEIAPQPAGELMPKPRVLAPKERTGPAETPAAPALRAPEAAAARPPEAQPAPQPAARAPEPSPQAAPAARPPAPPQGQHTGSVSDEIERDAKGGLVRVGKYRIVRKMGFGSAGDVFEGFDTHMGRKVAIKTITKDAAMHFDRAAERFVVEAKAAGSLNHPCINTIYDFGSIREVSYMVLEYLDGITLSQWMKIHPVPEPRGAAHLIQQMASALDFAHANHIIHRDLKPSNLMIVNNGATVKLLDFGIAKMEDVMLTQTGMTVGTPSYMSPEQLTGSKVGPASDQYGLAVVVYQIFSHKLPYLGTKIPELCNRILKNELVPITDVNPTLGAPFWDALRKALSKDPEDRYPNCMALYQALEAAFPAPQAAPAPA